jgi:Tfp pilus assembly protein PilZ
MTFQIPNSSRAVNAVGKVAWVEKAPDGVSATGRAGVGVKFSKIDPSDLQLIVDYVNRVARVVYSAS